MQTSINFDALKGKSKKEQLAILAGAAQFEMDKPKLALEMAKHASIVGNNHIRMAKGLNKPDDVSFERIKSFLALKYGTSSDNPQLVDPANQFAEFFHTNMPEMDLGWELLFDVVDLRNSVHDHFDILDTNAGVSWSQREPGEKTKIRKAITEALTTVSLVEYSDGLGLLDRWLERQMFWNIDEAIAEFRSNYFDKLASTHYGLLTALSSAINEAFATDDVTTANNAAATIIRAVKSKGYNAGMTAQFYAVCAVEKVGRLEKMLTAQRGSAIVDQGTVSQPLTVGIAGIIGTTNVTAADTGWYLVLPRRKMKRGLFKDMTIESDRDIYTSATDMVGVAQFNAAIGDSEQIRRCLYA